MLRGEFLPFLYALLRCCQGGVLSPCRSEVLDIVPQAMAAHLNLMVSRIEPELETYVYRLEQCHQLQLAAPFRKSFIALRLSHRRHQVNVNQDISFTKKNDGWFRWKKNNDKHKLPRYSRLNGVIRWEDFDSVSVIVVSYTPLKLKGWWRSVIPKLDNMKWSWSRPIKRLHKCASYLAEEGNGQWRVVAR